VIARWSGRSRSERGAIAIVVAVLATALFGCAALAVDLGNAWARKRAVQKQVDVSALAAGWKLPMTVANQSSIADRVASYFDDTNNQVTGQGAVTGAQLLNGDTADGEILWQNPDGSACSDNCLQMRVIAPAARVDFGFANIFGMSHTDVQRTATVRVVSELPPADETLPFWLPTGCGYGPTEADTTQGGTTSTATASPTATATTTTTSVRFQPDPTDVGTQALVGASVTEVGYMGATTVSGYSVSGLNGVKKVTLRAYPPTGTGYVDFAAQTTSNGSLPSFQVSQADITKIPGDWWIWALVRSGSTDYYSTNHLIIRVTGGPDPTATATPTVSDTGISVGCIGQDRGNFGQLDSPRHEGGSKQTRFGRNIALGLDHTLVPYVFAEGETERKQCDEPGYVLPAAQLDDISRNGNNCVIGDTGNDGPTTYDGLVTGLGDGTPGRLEVVHGHTTCHDRSDVSIDGHLINNDVLSCFLRHGATLASISATSGVSTSMLDPDVMKSPRFVWLPVVYAYDRAQKSFQPIRTFVPGFITDETQTSGATSSNGLELDGNSVKVLHVFTFNRDALPPLEDSRTTDYNASMGGAIVRLVG
jgi:hypothetical protein